MLDERYRSVLQTPDAAPGDDRRGGRRPGRPASLFNGHGRLMMIAADHPARGALPDRRADPGHGRPGRPARPALPGPLPPGQRRPRHPHDILEDLLLLGALEGKVVVGSMNRGGLAGTVFEIDDRFTAYDAASLAGRLRGGRC